ncbi:MAG TPA: hypothetical protein VH370_13380 [Humisphaera sp.]|jgi:hypothetical protein|nr:hypothetical protein [Humisphaera sp.]
MDDRGAIQARVYWQGLVALWSGFVVGFLISLAGGIYLLVKIYIPQDGWWAIVPGIMFTTAVPFLAAAWIGVCASIAADKWHHWRGYVRCMICGQVMRGRRVLCTCRDEHQFKPACLSPIARWRTALRHYRKRLGAFIFGLAVLGVISISLDYASPKHRSRAPFHDTFIIHVVLSNIVFLIGEFVATIAKRAKRLKRWRLRSTILVHMFAGWSIIGCIILIFT